jgi:hypothetical protein
MMAKFDWLKPHQRPKTATASLVGSNAPEPKATLTDVISDMTIADILAAVDDGTYELTRVLTAEMAGKNRITLVQQLNDRRA